MFTIYTDGACSRNTKKGGIGVYILETEQQLSEGYNDTTNNQMELLSIIKGLEMIKEPSEIIIYSDSQYCVKGANTWHKAWIKNNWITSAGEPVKNQELWQRLLKAKLFHKKVSFVWVKGHCKDSNIENYKYNNIVDKLAVKGKESV